MKTENVLLWLLIAMLLLAMVLTVLFAPRKTLHGYGELIRPGGNDYLQLPEPEGREEPFQG